MDPKKAATLGVLGVLGLGVARNADTCALVGLRAGRELGEHGALASRVASQADELGGVARVGGTVLDEARLGAAAEGGGALGKTGKDVFEAGLDGLDLIVETIEIVSDEDDEASTSSPTDARRTRCPRLLDVTRSDESWHALLRGFGIACAPVIVVGEAAAEGEALVLGGEVFPVVELAGACARAGGQCLFAACGSAELPACMLAAQASWSDTKLEPELIAYERALVRNLIAQTPSPAWIAVLEGTRLHLARPRRASRSSAPRR